MKKIIKISVCILFLLFVGLQNISAKKLTCEEITQNVKLYADYDFADYTGNVTGVMFNYKLKNGTAMYKYYPIYALKNSSGATYVSYCRNPDYTHGANNGTAYNCVESVFNTLDANERKDKYDAGIVEILKNGYSTIGKDYTPSYVRGTQSEATSFVATELSLRIYEMFWEEFDSNKSSSTGDMNLDAHRYYVDQFLDDAKIKSLLNNLGIVKNKFNAGIKPINWEFYKNGNKVADITSSVITKAKELVIVGLEGALKYQKYGAAKLNVSDPFEQSVITTTDSTGNKVYQKNITYTFKAENFKNNAYIKLNLNCKNCKTFSADYTIYINENNVGTIFPENLLTYIDSENNIKVRIEFKTSSNNYNCGTLKYALDIDYYDETINTEAYTLFSNACTTSSNCQKFYFMYNTGEDVFVEETIEDEFRLCKLNCNELKTQCEINKNQAACEEFKEQYNGTCAECGMQIQNTTCSETDSEINLNEGYEFDSETCTNSTSSNVLGCIINNKDDAGNSYEATNILKNNPYCTVWCKEDYHLTLPGIKEANSGRYFRLDASVNGTKTCYTSKIDKEQFENDYKSLNAEVQNAYNAYQNATGSDKTNKKNDLNTKIKDLEEVFETYNSCSNWDMNYKFNPEIKFWYEESYMNSNINDTLQSLGNISKEQVVASKCTADTDDVYEKCNNGWTKENQTDKVSLLTWYKDEKGNYVHGYKNFYISNTIRMKATITATGTYVTPTQFYSITPSGSIVHSVNGNDIENGSPLTNGLPVGLGTKNGVYNYTLMIKNLGEYYNSDKLGRIWGDENSVVSVTLNEKEANSVCSEGALKNNITINGKQFNNGVYVCGYKVNCLDCPVECDPGGCYNPNCPENNCPVECDSCIFNNNNSNINYRPITPEDINPNDRDLGKNWQHADNPEDIETAMELKAYMTTEEIESNGSNIYDVNFDSSAGTDFAMQVTLDSKMISKIREYNKKYEDEEGYLNNSLKCYNYEGEDSKTYYNVYCYSTFLDELLTDNSTKDNIKITGGTRYLSHEDRMSKTQWSGYWTTWSKGELAPNWSISTEIGFDYRINGVGPAWK